jgi:hypothetical protein
MVIYEVNVTVDPEVADAYIAWLGPHVEEVLRLPGFLEARWYDRKAADEGTVDGEKVLISVHYLVRDRASLDDYLAHHAPRLREDGLRRFPDRFTANRRILHLARTFEP